MGRLLSAFDKETMINYCGKSLDEIPLDEGIYSFTGLLSVKQSSLSATESKVHVSYNVLPSFVVKRCPIIMSVHKLFHLNEPDSIGLYLVYQNFIQ